MKKVLSHSETHLLLAKKTSHTLISQSHPYPRCPKSRSRIHGSLSQLNLVFRYENKRNGIIRANVVDSEKDVELDECWIPIIWWRLVWAAELRNFSFKALRSKFMSSSLVMLRYIHISVVFNMYDGPGFKIMESLCSVGWTPISIVPYL